MKRLFKINVSKIYIVLTMMLILVVLASYYSYAMFTVTIEKKNSISIITGELLYNLNSTDMISNQVKLNANETRIIEVTIKSLNIIESAYQLYYENNSNIIINYIGTKDNPYQEKIGIQNSNDDTRTTILVIKNTSTSEQNVILGVQGGLVGRNLMLLEGRTKISNEKSFTIKVNQLAGGSINLLVQSAKTGSKITFTTTVNENYVYNGATITNSNGDVLEILDESTKSFVMPASDVIITPDWLISLKNLLVAKANEKTVTSWNNSSTAQRHQLYQFNHEKTEQLETVNDYRYIGSDPYNYIWFNDEMWRIVSITSEHWPGDNSLNSLIKIVRNEGIGAYSFDNSTDISTYGSNSWNHSTLRILLNWDYKSTGRNYYWSRSKGKCYAGTSSATIDCDFSNTGLQNSAKQFIVGGQIMDHRPRWYTGADNWSVRSGKQLYINERSENYYTGSGVNTSRIYDPVALLYPSDYAYTYANGISDTCFNDLSKCKGTEASKGWMYLGKTFWLITPYLPTSYQEFVIGSDGTYWAPYANDIHEVRPTVFLLETVNYASGNGSKDNPYKIR